MAEENEQPTAQPSSDGDGGGAKGTGLDRRKAAVVGGAAVVVAGAAASAVGLARNAQGPNVPQGSLLVNGNVHKVQSSPDTPLLYVLRDEMGLKGPKFGCGLQQCGACSVLVDGKETRSCVASWTTVKGEVTTLEGLPARWAKQKNLSTSEAASTLHPVQQAWIDHQVPQCGYCQNGMMIMATQVLEQNPSASEAQIRDAFTNTPPSPHLCRCGTYRSIIAAVQSAGKNMA